MTTPTMPLPPIPADPAATLGAARTERHRIGAAVRASTLPTIQRLMVLTIADLADEAYFDGRPFAICLEEVSDATAMRPSHVAHAIADLIDHGWLTRAQSGWMLDAPAPRGAE